MLAQQQEGGNVAKDAELEAEVAAVFEYFDREATGIVRCDDLKAIFYALGIKISTKRAHWLWKKPGLTLDELTKVARDLVRIRPPLDRDDDVLDVLGDDVESFEKANSDLGLGLSKADIQLILADDPSKDDLLQMLQEEKQSKIDDDDIVQCHRRRRRRRHHQHHHTHRQACRITI